jgi:histidinol dehydrogenase
MSLRDENAVCGDRSASAEQTSCTVKAPVFQTGDAARGQIRGIGYNPPIMRQFDTAHDPPEAIHAALTARDHAKNAQIEAVVRGILDDVKARGDAAVLDYTRRFDWPGATIEALSTDDSPDAFEPQWDALPGELRESIRSADANIYDFHQAEKGHLQSWMNFSGPEFAPGPQGARALGQMLQPVERAGIYIPGGKAVYPSTILMALRPADIAGVRQFVICTPSNDRGELSPLIEAVIYFLRGEGIGDCRVFRIGGAQAIAAMAFGTETVPKCDVIVGPGNQYVNIAKKLVYGECAIDMLAGPSEVAVIADEFANPMLAAADILAQTEHGHDNRGVFFCHSWDVLEATKNELSRQRAALSRKEILDATALNLIFVKTNSLEESVALSNIMAPEHLELMVREPLAALPLVKNAGAVLLGEHTSASVGDYWAGPSHTLPTAGAARFSSPLSVNTFLKRTSVVYYSKKAAADAAEDVARFAEAEGFDGHAAAARLRGRLEPDTGSAGLFGESASGTEEEPPVASIESRRDFPHLNSPALPVPGSDAAGGSR